MQVKGEKPPAPTRGLSPAEVEAEAEEEDDDATDGGGMNIADLVPRNDIRQGKVQFRILLNDKNDLFLYS